ncbi:MAG: arylsulfotransferase family protein [Pseudomonadota bacterium]
MSERAAKILFTLTLIGVLTLGAFLGGIYSAQTRNALFVGFRDLKDNMKAVYETVTGTHGNFRFVQEIDPTTPVLNIPRPADVQPGLLLVARGAADRAFTLDVIDREGRLIHRMDPDWFAIWGDAGRFIKKQRPISLAPMIHGLDITSEGDVVFNFEHLSTIKMDLCGEVLWKLENNGHHSIDVQSDGTIWVPGEIQYQTEPTPFRNHGAPYRSWTLQHISADGEIIREIEVNEVLEANDLTGLLYLSTQQEETIVRGDTLHLNDIEVFPADMVRGVFSPGDIMISLRNINSILVLDPVTLKVKFRVTGRFMRQHDPDFIDGNRISVFDNRNLMPSNGWAGNASRIVEIDAQTSDMTEVVGDQSPRFFTDIQGAHSRLSNGNILVAVTHEGRLMEFLPDGRLAWEWHNRIADNMNAVITNAHVLALEMDEAYFKDRVSECGLRIRQ